MANFSESLTIRILGDSSQLQSELDAVVSRVTELGSRLAELGNVNQRLGNTATRLSSWIRPLQSINRLLGQAIQQSRQLSRVPITLNVSPALSALQTLSASIAAVAAQLRSLSQISAGGIGGFGRGVVPVQQFADGGLVLGPAGVDRIPALLTSGEFVLKRSAVQQMGTTFLQALNQSGSVPAANRQVQHIESPTLPTQHVTHFGGISIQVNQQAEIGDIIRDLELQGFRLRNRRG